MTLIKNLRHHTSGRGGAAARPVVGERRCNTTDGTSGWRQDEWVEGVRRCGREDKAEVGSASKVGWNACCKARGGIRFFLTVGRPTLSITDMFISSNLLKTYIKNHSLFFISFFTLSSTRKRQWQPLSTRAYIHVGRWVLSVSIFVKFVCQTVGGQFLLFCQN
jgi:hypothetical protein